MKKNCDYCTSPITKPTGTENRSRQKGKCVVIGRVVFYVGLTQMVLNYKLSMDVSLFNTILVMIILGPPPS